MMVAFLLSSCDQKKIDTLNEAFQNERDSLQRVIELKDHEIDDMIGTMNDVVEGFHAINDAEQRLTIARNDEGMTSAERIRENIQIMQQNMQQNRELINKLRKQLRESSLNGEQLKRTIESLTAQLQEKDEQLRALRTELEAKEIHIAELDETIAGLNEDVNALKEENTSKAETISTQDKQLHTAWYVFGTKKELKEQNILKDGKVLQQNFNKNYFTKIDIRVDNEIKLYSRDAEMLTSHPAGTYTLQRDANKQYVLRITNAEQFWSTSKYLVVLVK